MKVGDFLSWRGFFKTSLGVGGISALVVGMGVAAATAFGVALPAGLAAVPLGEVIVSGIAGLTAAAASPSSDTSSPATEEPAHGPLEWQIETLRHEFRGKVLDSVVSLTAYVAIGGPVAVIVFAIGPTLPVSAMVITALYAYLGLVRFVGVEQIMRPWLQTATVPSPSRGATTRGGFTSNSSVSGG